MSFGKRFFCPTSFFVFDPFWALVGHFLSALGVSGFANLRIFIILINQNIWDHRENPGNLCLAGSLQSVKTAAFLFARGLTVNAQI
jgi:hypothetical protein